MRHILVTGGAGFIGSHLVEDLLADGCQVTVIDNFDDYYCRSIKERNILAHRQNPLYRLVECDVRDLSALSSELSDNYDCIVHLAAKTGVRASVEDPISYQEVNVMGTQNLLELARRRGIPQFVFASSSSVYGANPNVPWREDDPVLLPISPYAASKVSGELLGHVYSHLYGIGFVALRLFTVYGPRQRPDLAIHKFTRLLLDGQPIPVFGDGSTRRDYTFVGDVVAGLRLAMSYRASSYEVINIAGSNPVRLRELIDALETVWGIEACLEFHLEQAGDMPQTFADPSKAEALLSFRCRTSLMEGLTKFARWYKLLNSRSASR